MMRRSLLAHLILALPVLSVGRSLTDALSAHPQALDLVRTALVDTGLDTSLDLKPSESTIFVPTDAALRQFLTNWGLSQAFLTDSSKTHSVRCLLKFMMLPEGPLGKATLTEQLPYFGMQSAGHRGAAVNTLCDSDCYTGPSCWRHLIVHADKHGQGSLLAGGGVVISADVTWRNGVAHIVDAVPNAVFWAPTGARSLHSLFHSRNDLGILWRAMVNTGLEYQLQRKGEQGHKYTLMAPTDAAIRKYISRWQMTEDDFAMGGDHYRPTASLLLSLLVRGFGDEADLWRAAAARGGVAWLETNCPCGGTVSLEASGDAKSRRIKVAGGSLVAQDQMWLGGPVHVVDIMPHAICWSGEGYTSRPPPVATTLAPLPTTRAAVPNTVPAFSCSEGIDAQLEKAMGDRVSLIREVFQANGLSDRLETWRFPVTVFAPTNEALRKFMEKYKLAEADLLVQGYMADSCIHQLFKNLVHETQLTVSEMKEWSAVNGPFELPTLCGEACSEGLWVSQRSSQVHINEGGIAVADLDWCNGLLHIIEDMPVPRGWTPGTMNCKASTNYATAYNEPSSSSNSTMLATGWTPQPKMSHPPIRLPDVWAVEHVALLVFAAAVMLVACSSMVFAWYVHSQRKSEKVLPEEAWKLPEDEPWKPAKMVPGIPIDLKKAPVKGLDLEKAMPVRDSWELGSQASTRLPSSRSSLPSSRSTLPSSRSMSTVSSSTTHTSYSSLNSKPPARPPPRISSHSMALGNDNMALALPSPAQPGLRDTAGAVVSSEPPSEFGRRASAPGEQSVRRSSSERRAKTGEGKSKSRRSRSEQKKARQPSLSAVQERPEAEQSRSSRR
mmetsp:Transcript_95481/g.169530  ORF Transcript_95481/g.169530 Transcript_95481/m.169530 type:complete len:837 (-) Transcript_95481:161-2671(-)